MFASDDLEHASPSPYPSGPSCARIEFPLATIRGRLRLRLTHPSLLDRHYYISSCAYFKYQCRQCNQSLLQTRLAIPPILSASAIMTDTTKSLEESLARLEHLQTQVCHSLTIDTHIFSLTISSSTHSAPPSQTSSHLSPGHKRAKRKCLPKSRNRRSLPPASSRLFATTGIPSKRSKSSPKPRRASRKILISAKVRRLRALDGLIVRKVRVDDFLPAMM